MARSRTISFGNCADNLRQELLALESSRKSPERKRAESSELHAVLVAWQSLMRLCEGEDALWSKPSSLAAADALLESIGPAHRERALLDALERLAGADCPLGIAWAVGVGASPLHPPRSRWTAICLEDNFSPRSLASFAALGALAPEALQWASLSDENGEIMAHHPIALALRWETAGKDPFEVQALLGTLRDCGFEHARSQSHRQRLFSTALSGGTLACLECDAQTVRASEFGQRGDEHILGALWLAAEEARFSPEIPPDPPWSRCAFYREWARSRDPSPMESMLEDTLSSFRGSGEWVDDYQIFAMARLLSDPAPEFFGSVSGDFGRRALLAATAGLASRQIEGDDSSASEPERVLLAALEARFGAATKPRARKV